MKLLRRVLLFFLIISPSLRAEMETQIMKQPIVVVETNLGAVEITLMPDVAPKTCENFLGLVGKKYYDGIIFHRIIKNFMIQGGDPTGTGAGGNPSGGKALPMNASQQLNLTNQVYSPWQIEAPIPMGANSLSRQPLPLGLT